MRDQDQWVRIATACLALTWIRAQIRRFAFNSHGFRKPGMAAHSYGWGRKISSLRLIWATKILFQSKIKKGWGYSSLVEYLPRMCKVPSQIPTTEKRYTFPAWEIEAGEKWNNWLEVQQQGASKCSSSFFVVVILWYWALNPGLHTELYTH